MADLSPLPARSLSRVESARAQAERDFIEKKSGIPEKAMDGLVAEYIHRVFFAFVEEACKAGREGHWTAKQVRQHVESYLVVAIDGGFDEVHPSGNLRMGGKRYLNPFVKDLFRDWLIPKTRQSPEWRAYLEELSGIANSETGDAPAGDGRVEIPNAKPFASAGGPKPAGRQRGRRGKDPELQKLRDKVRRMHRERLTQRDMCRQLNKDKEPRPPAAAWRHLTWFEALTDRKYGRSVRKWLSEASK